MERKREDSEAGRRICQTVSREEKRKEWAKHWQCHTEVPNPEDTLWSNEELKNLEKGRGFLRVIMRRRRGITRQRQEWDAMACIPKFRWISRENQEERWWSSWRRWNSVGDGHNKLAYLVWSRGHQALNENVETRGWIKIHPKLRVNACKN